MIALRFTILALSFLAGIVVATLSPAAIPAPVLLGPAALGLAGLLWISLRERHWHEVPIWQICLAASIMGAPLGFWRTSQQLGPPAVDHLAAVSAQIKDWTKVTIVGTVAATPEFRGEGLLDVRLAVDQLVVDGGEPIAVGDGLLLVRIEMGSRSKPDDDTRFDKLTVPAAYGYRVQIKTKWRSPEGARSPGAFDMAQFLKQEGLTARLKVYINDVTILEKSEGLWVKEIAFAAKSHFLRTYQQTVRAPGSRLAAAATLGERRALEDVDYRGEPVPDTFRHAGVGHVLAVSGLHVTIITILLYSMLRMTGLSPRYFVPAIIIFLGLFALLTGARPSSVRAVIMNTTVLLAFAYFRFNLRQATYVGLALSSIFILLGNPLVLYAPSFLLSFGAVLSLVLLSPTLYRWMNVLRGWSLLLTIGWSALVLVMTCSGLSFFLTPWNVLALMGLLWLLILTGGALNNRFPVCWTVGLHVIPAPVRMFIAAQLAIQFGMMIPLSAWFFGQFPVAGIYVNLIAIPLVGVLVQLAMLTGLLGMLPAVGIYAAMPLGAATTIVADFFLWTAHTGASLVPFPAMPRPTVEWLIAYYLILGLVLYLDRGRAKLQGWLYRAWPAQHGRNAWTLAAWGAPIVLMLLSLITVFGPKPVAQQIVVYDTRDFPVISVSTNRGTAATINAGNGFTGGNALFSGVRNAGAVRITTGIITGFDPAIGNDGMASLAQKMRVEEILLPEVPNQPGQYLAAIGDSYLLDNANKQKPWALAFQEAYSRLHQTAHTQNTRLRSYTPGETIKIGDAELRLLPAAATLPSRYISTARTGIVALEVAGYHWLVLTDALPSVFQEVVPASCPVDILVLPTSTRRYYQPLIDAAVTRCQPQVVIVSGGRPGRSFDPAQWAEGQDFTLLTTDAHGAIVAKPQPDGTLNLTGHVSGQQMVLTEPRQGPK